MFKLSNENIIFLFLQSKRELGEIDKALLKLEEFYESKKKELDDMFSNKKSSELPPGAALAKKLIEQISPGMGYSNDMLKQEFQQELDKFYQYKKDSLNTSLGIRSEIINDLKMAFDVLKDEMPEIVSSFTNIIDMENAPLEEQIRMIRR